MAPSGGVADSLNELAQGNDEVILRGQPTSRTGLFAFLLSLLGTAAPETGRLICVLVGPLD